MDYFQLQEAVFSHLWNKHQQDNKFTFSVRQVASKGGEKNYFVGTDKSVYFGFTCWDIPVTFPGASGDLTLFYFTKKENLWLLRFQYFMSKSAEGEQNAGNLVFGRELLSNLQSAGINVYKNDESNKMLYFYVQLTAPGVSNTNELLQEFDTLYALVAPVVEAAVEATKQTHPQWQAGRFTNQKFDTLVSKMHQRIQRFTNATPEEIAKLPEENNANNNVAAETKVQHPLNTILYGPPGTGKTYNTINKAVQIINPSFFNETKGREEIRQEYERLKAEGQIEFITFHQSMSYEDFIEGIKPKEPKEGDTFLKYEIQPGIFKTIAKRAEHTPSIEESRFSLTPKEYAQANFYKISLGNTAEPDDEQIYRHCINNNYIAIGWGDGNDFTGKSEHEINIMKPLLSKEYAAKPINYFIHYLKVGDYVVVSKGNSYFRAIGKVTGNYEYKQVEGLEVRQFRKVQWLLKDVNIPVEELYNKQFSQQTIYKLNKEDIKEDFFVKNAVPIKQEGVIKKNYVLIIDEINRGNVSQIFGELITLIEEDKRQGNKEALEVILPYSKEKFSVPSNLYIIGTMNTADRSVEALDTALRRRFVFAEMEPKPELLDTKHLLWQFLWEYKDVDWEDSDFQVKEQEFYDFIGVDTSFEGAKKEGVWDKWKDEGMNDWQIESLGDFNFTGINLQQMLSTVNNRLQVLLSRDHTIGHAWLMNVYNLHDLQSAFKNKILPLLQEYFYNNYAKIGLVLGNAFVAQKQVDKKLFARFTNSEDITNDYEEKIIYTLVDPFTVDVVAFKFIYE